MSVTAEIDAGPEDGEQLAHAPGKLFVSGEYGVVEPGQPAVLVAVDRRLTVKVRPAVETQDLTGRGWSYVAAVRDVMDALARAHGRPRPPFRVRTLSDLEDADVDGTGPRKYGLGSSAAVTAAGVVALDAWHGLGLTREELLRAALLVTLRVNPRASGADVATCLVGGWTAYSSPERAWVRERVGDGASADPGALADLVAQPWPGLEARALPTPSFEVAIGWTGAPASTVSLVAAVRAAGRLPGWFVAAAATCAREVAAAVERDDLTDASEAVRANRAHLRALADAVGVPIETPVLTALAEVADGLGVAAKPSGAGGGDCGVALVAGAEKRTRLEEAWRAAGVVPLGARLAVGTVLGERAG
ncbi:phosphomevalonate kinase [Litorihabitans aurantiacus]|uniref:phosphomevalonate kinase n=1 Tax=Litorihabitans aurantiacus TaxID=1930061 RepID=A0AA37XAP6_9MICO|nr:phosphomevalonate kinase [Litorihabitans aurantiacus]GMA30224.1 phosphomevalonate kinase [Litorihabitans aurantiacus]